MLLLLTLQYVKYLEISCFEFNISKSGSNFLFCSASLSLCPSPQHGDSFSGSVGLFTGSHVHWLSRVSHLSLASLCCRVWPARGVGSPETAPHVSVKAWGEKASPRSTVEGLSAYLLLSETQGQPWSCSFQQSTPLWRHLGYFHSTFWDLESFPSFSKRIKSFSPTPLPWAEPSSQGSSFHRAVKSFSSSQAMCSV